MWFSRKRMGSAPAVGGQAVTSKSRGDLAEDVALAHLQGQGLKLVERNFKTPGRGGGEVDLIMRAPDGTLVFVEVRQRAAASRGGAGGSITAIKQRRIVLAARHFLLQLGSIPACRFDVVLIDGRLPATTSHARGAQIEWICGAFDATGSF
jgi:putative endonuclease